MMKPIHWNSWAHSGTTRDFEDVADGMREALTLDPDWASGNTTWDAALRFLRNRIEEVGVLVFINGIVGNNTHRKLDPDEFRGLALIDEYAPLIFINNADYTSAQNVHHSP